MSSEIKADKWSPASGTSATIGDSGDTYTIPSGVTFTNNGTANGFGITAANFRPNANPLIINGDMAVAQRGTSVSSANSSGYKAIDRYRHTISIATWTISQSTDVPTGQGFAKSMKMDCTTAEASPGSTDALAFVQKIEGQDLQLLKKGTSNAEKLTVAFWVKCTKTGTAQVNLVDEDNTRMIGQQFTVNATNTWEKKVLSFNADTSGALGNDNGSSLRLEIWLDAGSSYKSGATPTSWESLNTADYFAGGTLNLGDNTSNDIYITGIQLEVGEYTSSTLPPFQHESYGNNLVRCHRYFLYTGGGSAYQHHGSGVEVSSTAAYMTTPLSCPFRASPSITANNTSGGIVIYDGNTESAVTSVGTTNYSKNTSIVNVAVNASGGGLDDGNGITVYSNANSNAGFLFDAEL
jgi:hypothetical protein